MRTINFPDARDRLEQVLDQTVEDAADVTVVTRRDAPDVVVISLEEGDALAVVASQDHHG